MGREGKGEGGGLLMEEKAWPNTLSHDEAIPLLDSANYPEFFQRMASAFITHFAHGTLTVVDSWARCRDVC